MNKVLYICQKCGENYYEKDAIKVKQGLIYKLACPKCKSLDNIGIMPLSSNSDKFAEEENLNLKFKAGDRVFNKVARKWVNIIEFDIETGLYIVQYDDGIRGRSLESEMIEGLVEEENNDCEKCGLTRNSIRCLFMDNCPHNKHKNIIEIPKDYVLKDENGNIINATKIVLEKKKEYPKKFVDCCTILYPNDNFQVVSQRVKGHKGDLLFRFQKLIICRDAYWKIAGEEMGLGKPWEPDWNNISDKYCIYFVSGDVWSKECQTRQCPFAFPTPEMRDAFKENFDPDIEICKEFL